LRSKPLYISITLIATVLLLAYFIIRNKAVNNSKFKDWDRFTIEKRIEKTEKHLALVKKSEDYEGIIEAYAYLGNCYYEQFRSNESLNCFINAYEFTEKYNKENISPDITYKLAINYLDIGEYLKAHEFAIRTDSIERTNKSRSAETLNLLGNIYEKTGLFVKSLAMHYESLELQKRNNNRIGIANSYHNLAHIQMAGQRYDKASTFYSKALEIYQQLPEKQKDSTSVKISIGKIKLSIGNYFTSQNDSLNAFKFLQEALVIFKEENSKTNIAQTHFYFGNYHFANQNFEIAEEYYLKSLAINNRSNNKIGKVVTKLNLSKVYYSQGKIVETIETLKKIITLTSEIGAKRQLAETADLLYSIYINFPDSVDQIKEYAGLFYKTKKYLPNELMQDSIIQMSVHHEVTAQKNEEIEIERYKKNTQIILLLSLLAIIVITTVFIFYRRNAKQKRRYEQKLAEEQLQRFKEIVDAIENERKRIAVDLHDSLGQMLSTTKLYLSGLEDMVEDQNKNDKKLYSDTITLLDESCSELRNISYNIMPGTFIKYGLIVSINELVNIINETNKIEVNFRNVGIESRYNENLEISVYRIVQEALNNILKHANANMININLSQENKLLALSIKDNGKGMDNIELYKNKGLGWKSIFSRVQMLNGNINVITGINKGTNINIRIPL